MFPAAIFDCSVDHIDRVLLTLRLFCRRWPHGVSTFFAERTLPWLLYPFFSLVGAQKAWSFSYLFLGLLLGLGEDVDLFADDFLGTKQWPFDTRTFLYSVSDAVLFVFWLGVDLIEAFQAVLGSNFAVESGWSSPIAVPEVVVRCWTAIRLRGVELLAIEQAGK